MDTRTEQAVEDTLVGELLDNSRIIEHPKYGRVRLKRPTPKQDRLIAESRRKQYHADMQNDAILSRAELEKIAVRRGMWSSEDAQRIEYLTRRTGEAMGLLDAIGFRSLQELVDDYRECVNELSSQFEGNDEVLDAIRRYFDLDGSALTADQSTILDNAMSSDVPDLLEKGEGLRTQIELLQEMFLVRKELNELQERQARLFLDSIESRSDRAEELAKVYYCCTDADTGKHLWPRVEDIEDVDAEDIEDLLIELHYFIYGITPEFKETLGKYGFIKRQSDTNPSSEDSPVLPPSNSDGESVESDTTSSSEATE